MGFYFLPIQEVMQRAGRVSVTGITWNLRQVRLICSNPDSK